jgi:hypothetical protein
MRVFKNIGGMERAVGTLEFLGEGMPLGGVEVMLVVEGVFEGNSFVLEVVDGGGPLPIENPWNEDWYEDEEWYKEWWKSHEVPRQALRLNGDHDGVGYEGEEERVIKTGLVSTRLYESVVYS